MANRFLYLARHGEAGKDGGLSEAGRQQARLLGERLRDAPLSAIHHGPLPRAAQTAALLAEHLSGVPVHQSELVGDFIPSVPDLGLLPPAYAKLVESYSPPSAPKGPPWPRRPSSATR